MVRDHDEVRAIQELLDHRAEPLHVGLVQGRATLESGSKLVDGVDGEVEPLKKGSNLLVRHGAMTDSLPDNRIKGSGDVGEQHTDGDRLSFGKKKKGTFECMKETL